MIELVRLAIAAAGVFWWPSILKDLGWIHPPLDDVALHTRQATP